MMQITKSRLFLAACGVQLDNGVTPPWTIHSDLARALGA